MMVAGLGGDQQAHASLLTALVPLLRSFYRRRIRDAEDDTEDLVQETLIAVHDQRASYDRNRAFTAWLYAIARYKLVDHYRRLNQPRRYGHRRCREYCTSIQQLRTPHQVSVRAPASDPVLQRRRFHELRVCLKAGFELGGGGRREGCGRGVRGNQAGEQNDNGCKRLHVEFPSMS